MAMTDHASELYPPVGECIYCGRGPSPNVALTKEHIFAQGLGGRWILPEASCTECQKATTRIEDAVLVYHFGLARTQLGLRRRDRKGPPRKTYTIRSAAGGVVQDQELTEDAAPLVIVMPLLDPPGILRGLPASHPASWEPRLCYRPRDVFGRSQPAGSGVDVLSKFSPTEFTRMLAKIAHAYAIAERGVAGFRPFLNDIIRTGQGEIPHYIGGLNERPRISHGIWRCRGPFPFAFSLKQVTPLHKIGLLDVDSGTGAYLVAHVHLFTSYQTPPYLVVVGETNRADSPDSTN